MRKPDEHETTPRGSQSQMRCNAVREQDERRVALRYALHARVVFAWDDAKGEKRESRGHTRDLGQKGAFVLAQECPARDTAISLSIFLPVTGTEKRVLRLEVEGRVLRSGAAGGGNGVNQATAPIGFAVSHQRVNLFSS
jgi:hypothetical protein